MSEHTCVNPTGETQQGTKATQHCVHRVWTSPTEAGLGGSVQGEGVEVEEMPRER